MTLYGLVQEYVLMHYHNNSYWLLKAFYMPDIALSPLYILFKPYDKLIGQAYHLYFTDDNDKT